MLDIIAYSMLNGMLLFMMSSGLMLIFGMMGVLNFAHASFYMLGAYFAYTIGWLPASGLPCSLLQSWSAWWEPGWNATD
jgi:branched-subunit amino acid ABC-type transport system permease component